MASDAMSVRELARVPNGSEPWLLESLDQMALIRRLEQQFPTLEEAGCNVGIGVATGADNAFIGAFDDIDVEPDRKLPLVMTKDIISGEAVWHGLGVVNPFTEEAGLVDLRDYPRLRRYLEARRGIIARVIARKNSGQLYRTIDRITPGACRKAKAAYSDIKGEAHIVFEDGHLYPHQQSLLRHLRCLGPARIAAVLLSAVTRLFCGDLFDQDARGFLRFQAQYLRRIRVPMWRDVPRAAGGIGPGWLSARLAGVQPRRFDLYNLSDDEHQCLEQRRINGS